jgi:hypothetical protein
MDTTEDKVAEPSVIQLRDQLAHVRGVLAEEHQRVVELQRTRDVLEGEVTLRDQRIAGLEVELAAVRKSSHVNYAGSVLPARLVLQAKGAAEKLARAELERVRGAATALHAVVREVAAGQLDHEGAQGFHDRVRPIAQYADREFRAALASTLEGAETHNRSTEEVMPSDPASEGGLRATRGASVAPAGSASAAAGPAASPPPQPERVLARIQPCGCVVCRCEDPRQCHGCGAKSCGTHPVGEIPSPVYEPAPQPPRGLPALLGAMPELPEPQPAVDWKAAHEELKTLGFDGRVEKICDLLGIEGDAAEYLDSAFRLEAEISYDQGWGDGRDAPGAPPSPAPVQPEASLRPEVLAFAQAMSAKLDGHNHDRGEYGWRTAPPARLMRWLDGYVESLRDALLRRERHPAAGTSEEGPSLLSALVTSKAVNVANLAMMIADVCGALAAPVQRAPVQPGEARCRCGHTHERSKTGLDLPCTVYRFTTGGSRVLCGCPEFQAAPAPVQRSEGPVSDMALPDGKTCADCRSFRRCQWLINRWGTEKACDWSPSRFRPAPPPSSALEPQG